MNLATAYVEIRIDRKKAEADAKSAAKGAHDAIANVFKGALVIEGFKKAIDSASNLQQAVGATEAVFGKATTAVDEFAKTSAASFGISQRSARELTAQVGALLQGFGFTQEQAASTSVEIAKLGSDLSAAFGGKPQEAVEALGSALRGEFDPLERYGVSLNAARIAAKAVELGLASSTTTVDAHAKATAALAIIQESSAGVAGQFGREIETAAGQQAVAAAKAEDAAASFGDVLLPVYTRLVTVVGKLAEVFGELPPALQTAVVGLVAFAAFSGPINKVKDIVLDFSKALTKVGISAGAQVTALALLGVAMVGLAAHQKLVADRNNEITKSINALSTASDAQVLNEFFNAFSEGLFKTKSAAGALDEIAQANIEGARRTLELGRATGENVPIFDALEAAIRKEEAAQAQATVTSEQYATTLTDTGKAASGAATGGLRTFSDAAHTAGQAALDAKVDTDSLNAAVEQLRGTLDAREAVRSFEEAMFNYRAAAAPTEADTDALIDKMLTLIETLDNIPDETKTKLVAELDQGNIDFVESRLAFVARNRVVQISGQLVGADLRNAQEGRGTQSASGRYVPGGANLISTFGEQGPEAILPLDKPNRLVQLLGDPRIGGPVAEAFGGLGGSTSSSVQLIVEGNIYGDAALEAKLGAAFDTFSRATASSIARGLRG